MDPKIASYPYGRWTVIDVLGRLDDSSTSMLRTHLHHALDHHPHVALNLTASQLAGARWLTVVAESHKLAQRNGALLAVIHPAGRPSAGLYVLARAERVLIYTRMEELDQGTGTQASATPHDRAPGRLHPIAEDTSD